MKSEDSSRKCWIPRVNFFKEGIECPGKSLEIKLINDKKENHDKKECEEFEMALKHNSKLHVYKELKQEVGCEEYLEHIKGPLSIVFKGSFRCSWTF